MANPKNVRYHKILRAFTPTASSTSSFFITFHFSFATAFETEHCSTASKRNCLASKSFKKLVYMQKENYSRRFLFFLFSTNHKFTSFDWISTAAPVNGNWSLRWLWRNERGSCVGMKRTLSLKYLIVMLFAYCAYLTLLLSRVNSKQWSWIII